MARGIEYTGRRLVCSAREREDGWWRIWMWLDDVSNDDEAVGRVDQAWKAKPLQFDGGVWQMLALAQEMVVHLKEQAHLAGDEQPDALDLWGDV